MTTNPTDAQMKRIMKARETPYDGGIWEGRKLNKGPFVTIRLSDLDALLAIQATEARAQGLVDALEMMDGIEYKELNLSNYTHDDVCALNNAYVEMQLILTQALATWRRT